MIFRQLAEAYRWHPEIVLGLTMRQVRIYSTAKEKVAEIGVEWIPQSKPAKKAWRIKVDRAVNNLMHNRPWDV